MQSTLTVKGQVTLPKSIREHLKVSAGDRVKFFTQPDGGVTILPVVPISSLRGILKGRIDRVVTVEEMNEAIGEGIVSRYLESTQD